MIQYRKLNSIMVYIILSLLTIDVFGQTQNFSREQMLQDIDTLFSTIGQVHPDMYAVYPQKQLDKDIEKVKSELEPNGDIFYFYKQVTPLVVQLGDGHTGVLFPRNSLKKISDIKLFPFPIQVTYPDKAIEVQNDYTQNQNSIPVGACITSINHKQATDIVQEMMNYTSGEEEFFKTEQLAYTFTPLIYTLYKDSIFDIEYLYQSKKYLVQVKGISYKERYERPQQNSSESNKFYSFTALPDKNIGIVEFNSFNDLDRFKVFLDSTFQIMKEDNIGNLIIDVRKNGGGNSALGDEFFQYISPVPFAQYGETTVKYSDILKQFYKTYDDWNISNPNGIEINNSDELIELRENNLRYNGNVFLLISHYTFSSAANFSWAFKYFKMGTVIGEETGGLAVCFGDIITPKLPNSGLYYSISWKKFYSYGATDKDTHGTLPDFEVEADKALGFTIDLITKKK